MSELLDYLKRISAAAATTEVTAREEGPLRTLEVLEQIQFAVSSASGLLKRTLHEEIPEGIDRVLLVKSDAARRGEIAGQLRMNGFLVAEVSGGVEAIEYLYEMPQPGMIITDLVMEDCDGWELIKVARTSKVGTGVLMVALTDSEKAERPLPTLDLLLSNQTDASEIAQNARKLINLQLEDEDSSSPLTPVIKNRAS